MDKVVIILLLFVSSAFAGEKTQTRQELRTWAEDRWAVVTVREVTGNVIAVSPLVGREIDFEEGNRFAIFQGATEYTKRLYLPTLTVPITGFQSAVFLELADEKFGVCVTYRDDAGLHVRFLRLRNRKELARICDYMHWMVGEQERPAGYPMVTDETATFEVVMATYQPGDRIHVQMELSNGERMKGELLPIMEDGQMLIETPLGFQRVDVPQVQQIWINLRGGKRVVRKTLTNGIGYAVIGAFAGLLAGGLENFTVKDELLFGAMIGGSIGAAFGFLDGLLSLEPAVTFRLSPTKKKSSEPQIRITPMRIQIGF